MADLGDGVTSWQIHVRPKREHEDMINNTLYILEKMRRTFRPTSSLRPRQHTSYLHNQRSSLREVAEQVAVGAVGPSLPPSPMASSVF